jgi:molybdate-binding protein
MLYAMTQVVQEVTERLVADVVSGRLAPGDRAPSVRELADREGCAAGTAARALARLRAAGVIGGPTRRRAVVAQDGERRALAMDLDAGILRLAGSDDPALDALVGFAGASVERAAGPRGSVAGLALLGQGAVDAAAVHLRDATTGRSNDVFVRWPFGQEPARIVHLWSRQQGLVVASGNPLGIRGVQALEGARLAWRGAGTGSRLLMARLLRESAVTPSSGGEPCESHIGVAVAVAAGAADAGLAVRSAAEAVGADFVPLEWEDFEMAVAPDALARLGPVLDALASTRLQDRLAAAPGYDLQRSGDVRVAA